MSKKKIICVILIMIFVVMITLLIKNTYNTEITDISIETYNITSNKEVIYSVDIDICRPKEIIEQEVASRSSVRVFKCTEEEKDMIAHVVQNEVNKSDMEHRMIIVDIILNRVESGIFQSTVYEVLHAKGQFPTINNYYKVKFPVDDDTRQAVENVINGEYRGISGGALYFYNPDYSSESASVWFESKEFIREISTTTGRHRFFK